MIEVLDVPNFKHILIHCGNDEDDTSGCLLLGNSQTENIASTGFVGSSTVAYKRVYPEIAEAIEKENVQSHTLITMADKKIKDTGLGRWLKRRHQTCSIPLETCSPIVGRWAW